ncbi:MAG: hypothetical protein WCA22_06180 [Candidatus Binatus sp.]
MERAGYFSFRIDHQDGHTVGGEYSQHDAWLGSDYAVAGRPQRSGVASRGVNDVAMHLVQPRDEFEIRHVAADALPVGIDGAFVVADPIGEIHRGERARADATRAPDEAVTNRSIGPCAKDFDAA